MGESAAETVREIEETRDRLDGELRALEDRLPRPAVWTKRIAGVAIGGGVAGAAFWFLVRRRRAKRVPSTSANVQAVVHVLPEGLAARLEHAVEDGRWRGTAMGVAGVWLALRLAELRQLRRMNRALLAAR